MSLRNLIFIFLLTMFNFTSIKSKTIKCEYSWKTFDDPYSCSLENREIFTGDRVSIEKAVGEHWRGKTDDDVEGLWIDSANIKFFPRNINNVFKNIKHISIILSKLAAVTSEDLKVFPKLTVLNLASNQIEVIREDTFKFNPNLEEIYLSYNKISHIELKTFSGLENLIALSLNNNVCELGYAENREKLFEMIKQIEQGNCQIRKLSNK